MAARPAAVPVDGIQSPRPAGRVRVAFWIIAGPKRAKNRHHRRTQIMVRDVGTATGVDPSAVAVGQKTTLISAVRTTTSAMAKEVGGIVAAMPILRAVRSAR